MPMPENTSYPDQEAIFDIEGPDEDGCVWICAAGGRRDLWCHNLGRAEKVTEKLSQWMAEQDDAETF